MPTEKAIEGNLTPIDINKHLEWKKHWALLSSE